MSRSCSWRSGRALSSSFNWRIICHLARTSFATTTLVVSVSSSGIAATTESLGSSAITHDAVERTWTLTAGGAQLTLSLDRSSDFLVRDLVSPTGRHWLPAPLADTTVTINGKSAELGRRSAGFELEDVRTTNTGHTLRLDAVFRYHPERVRVVRHFAVADGSPTFEVWTTFEPLGAEVSIEDITAFELKVPEGTVRWLNGLRGDNADVHRADAFLRQSHRLGPGEALAWGADGRSSESTVPWFAIDGEDDELYLALLWSGAWRADVWRNDDALSVRVGLIGMSTALGRRLIEGPHAVFGVAKGGLAQVSSALHTYVVNGIRGGRGFSPLVAFNTWFADGTRIDEASIRGEIQRVAPLGVELFVLDAGWYVRAGAQGMFDFDSGLGTWEVDRERFPNGLGALSDFAHQLGMRFGIWVEPERVDLDSLRGSGLDESALATSGGRQVTEHTGQVCLAGAGRQWVTDHLTAFIDEVRPDYLKWDNNAWLNCDREGQGHDHGPTDGNFAHVTGLYEILAELKERFPDLTIENVSGGGNRLDLGMLRYTDVGWMDDRSAPGVLVRHNAEGLSLAFPPAYLYSFVTQQDPSEALNEQGDIALTFRSRMLGAIGLSFSLPGIVVTDAIAAELAIYKRLRPILARAAGVLLSEQAAAENGPPWDVFQATTPDGDRAIVFVFQSQRDGGGLRVSLTALDPHATYAVESVDAGMLGTSTGDELMIDGVEFFSSPVTGAHVLILTRVEPAPQ